jgi:hypothetical protein
VAQIVNLYHAREHLHEFAGMLAFILGGHHKEWLTARLTELDTGDIPGSPLASSLTGLKARDLGRALGYFETNARRMHYAHFRALGMFVGSRAVETGCKALIGQRLKLSEMRWSVPGAADIATPALLERQRSMGRHLAGPPQPDNRRLTPLLTGAYTLRCSG